MNKDIREKTIDFYDMVMHPLTDDMYSRGMELGLRVMANYILALEGYGPETIRKKEWKEQ